MSGMKWHRDAEKQRMRDRGSEQVDGDTTTALYGATPRKRTPKADQRAEADRLVAEFEARKAKKPA
jgi:hypothetical protein